MDSKEKDDLDIFLTSDDTTQMSLDLSSTTYMSSPIDSITLSSPTYTISSITPATTTIGGILTSSGSNGVNWTNGAIGSGSFGAQPQGKISLKGKDADIDINGKSLLKTLQHIEDRLNILRPNPELEEKWDQLRELGEQYRKLELELTEKQKMWDTLKSMPPPKVPE